jgi:hypothetical protein
MFQLPLLRLPSLVFALLVALSPSALDQRRSPLREYSVVLFLPGADHDLCSFDDGPYTWNSKLVDLLDKNGAKGYVHS